MYIFLLLLLSSSSSFLFGWGEGEVAGEGGAWGGGNGCACYHLAVNGHEIKHCLFGWNVLSSFVGQRLHFKFYTLLCERFGFSVHTSKILSLLPIFRIG